MGWYVLLGSLAAFGMLCALWTLLGWMLPRGDGVLVVPARHGRLPELRGYLWLRSLGLLRCRLAAADLGLEQPERDWLERNGIEIHGPQSWIGGP